MPPSEGPNVGVRLSPSRLWPGGHPRQPAHLRPRDGAPRLRELVGERSHRGAARHQLALSLQRHRPVPPSARRNLPRAAHCPRHGRGGDGAGAAPHHRPPPAPSPSPPPRPSPPPPPPTLRPP